MAQFRAQLATDALQPVYHRARFVVPVDGGTTEVVTKLAVVAFFRLELDRFEAGVLAALFPDHQARMFGDDHRRAGVVDGLAQRLAELFHVVRIEFADVFHASAFDELLGGEGETAVIIGSDSPDLPVQYIKRAFLKLKHKDVVLGPAADGGYYLVGLRKPAPAIFEDIEWGGPVVLSRTIERIQSQDLTLSLLPLWYDVDTPASLQLLRDLIQARKVEKSGRLPATEAVLEALSRHGAT